MKNIKTTCLFILLLFICSNVLIAQKTQPTPYQKKQLELSKKWFQVFYGYNMTMGDEAFYEQLAQGKDAQEFLLALGILGYAMNNSKAQVQKVIAQMKYDYAQSEKLKNATDFKLEKERKLLSEQETFRKTDFGGIQYNIKTAFEKWNQKGEFEKEADYEIRMKNQSQIAFDGICLEKIKNRINYK